MKRKILTEEEKQKIMEFYYDFRKNPVLLQLYSTQQHRTSNTYRHVNMVTKESFKFAVKHHYDIDYYSLVRGAMLHDLFFYDWRKHKEKAKGHLWSHPVEAYNNAKEHFNLNEIEKDIILNHMWPIKLNTYPKSREAKIVSLIDKKVTFMEFFDHKKPMIVFDLDGTLIDTLPDLTTAVNHAMRLNNFEEKSIEFVRKAIGNGIKILIQRCVPENTSEEVYQKTLDDFKQYYINNSMDQTVPYEGMFETLKWLRLHGYKIAVNTNKNENMAKAIIDHFFPNMVLEVVGATEKIPPKPAVDMMFETLHRLKSKFKTGVIYIGDTEVDYEYANKCMVDKLIVTYGYRSKEELENKKVNATFIDSPLDIKKYFRTYFFRRG